MTHTTFKTRDLQLQRFRPTTLEHAAFKTQSFSKSSVGLDNIMTSTWNDMHDVRQLQSRRRRGNGAHTHTAFEIQSYCTSKVIGLDNRVRSTWNDVCQLQIRRREVGEGHPASERLEV